MKNYYALLGVESNATKFEIKKNYRTLATKFHPDKNSDPLSTSKFIEITEAYDVLSNKKSKLKYDLLLYENAKQSKASVENFTAVVVPKENLRTRQNKAQQARSIKYHHTQSTSNRLWLLLVEGFYIFGRSVQHLIGICLLTVILISALKHLPQQFNSNWGLGLGVGLFIIGLTYALFKLIQTLIVKIRKDVEAFSVFYRISFRLIVMFTLGVFLLLSTLIIAALNVLRP